MQILIVICVLLIIFIVVQAAIPLNEIDIKLYDDPSFESQVNRAYSEAKAAIREANLAAKAGGKALSAIPYAGEIVKEGVQALVDGEINRITDAALIKAIADETHRAIARGKIKDIEASMMTISQTFRSLNRVTDLSSSSKLSLVHITHIEIQKILYLIDDAHSIFREFPLLLIPTFSTLATIISVFEPMFDNFTPTLASVSFLPCKLNDILLEYRTLAVRSRFQYLIPRRGIESEFYHSECNILNQPYKSSGYNKTNDGSIKCIQLNCKWHLCKLVASAYFKDTISSERYRSYCPSNYCYHRHCIEGYMELIRYRVEKAFENPIDLMNEVCAEDVQNKRNATGNYTNTHMERFSIFLNLFIVLWTGFGWLTIILNDTVAVELDGGGECDILDEVCDPYVRILFDGQEVFRVDSDWLWKFGSRDLRCVNKLYKSNKISKTVAITFEMWDKDDIGADEFILKKIVHIDEILNSFSISSGKNSLSMTAFWKNEYDDN